MAGTSPVVALHNHTEFSSFDGMQRLDEMCEAVAADPAWAESGRQPACAITDHGTLGGTWKFAKAASSAGVKPIMGMEAYIAIGSRLERNSESDSSGTDADEKGSGEGKTRRYQHLTVHALNKQGWKNLLKISNEAHDHYWYKPRTDLEFIGQHNEGLMIGTGCLGGPVASKLLKGDYEGARNAVKQLLDVVGGDRNRLFVEVMSHGLDGSCSGEFTDEKGHRHKTFLPNEDGLVLPKLADLAREFRLRIVSTNDSHYTHKHHGGTFVHPDKMKANKQTGAHDAWLAIGVNRNLDSAERFRFQGEGYWMRSAAEMNALMAKFGREFGDQDPVANTLWVADQVEENVLAESRLRLPKFPLDQQLLAKFMHERGEHRDRFSSDTEFYLHELTRRGAIERYGNPLPTVVKERLAYEMGIIGNAGLWDYFLIVADMINWARSQGILNGPGRGSAAGCAVSFCNGIVDVDPIANGLLMERFLDPYRAGMPDIDSDFDQEGRDKVIGYLMEKYGEDHVARIGTYGTMGVKKAVRDIARLLPSVETEVGGILANTVPSVGGKPLSFKKLLERDLDAEGSDDPKTAARARELWAIGQDFRDVLAGENGADARKIVEISRPLEGIITSEGIHACGVLVSSEPLDELVPTRRDQKSKNKTRVTTWEAPDIEDLGLLKLDDLGLRTLDVISVCLRMIEETTGEQVNIRYGILPMDGTTNRRARAAWDLISSGKTQGVFQLEGSGMAKLCQAVAPESLEDISAVVALYRPGPLGTGMHERYAARKHGHEPVSYDYLTRDPREQEIIGSVLDDTQAVVCYQEQIMQLSGLVAGFGPGLKNKLRKAFSKKKRDEMEALEKKFLAGAVIATEDNFDAEVDTSASEVFQVETARELWKTFDASAEYLFNKSHSAGYGYLAYVTAYLKANWPSHYGAALLSVTKDDEKRLATLGYLRDEGLEVLNPDVNSGGVRTSVSQAGAIRLGMAEVKGVGLNAQSIVDERESNGPFRSLSDLMTRVKVVKPTASTNAIKTDINAFNKEHGLSEAPFCFSCLKLRFNESNIAAAETDEQAEALRTRAELFGSCQCTSPATELAEEQETSRELDASELSDPSWSGVVKLAKSGKGYSLRYRLVREEYEPVLDADGNPVMETSNLSTGIVEALIEAGACDCFDQPRAGMTAVVRALREVPDMMIPAVEWPYIERAKRERTRLGMVASGSPLSQIGGARIKEWATETSVDGLRASNLIPLHRIDEHMDYVVTIGVVSQWEVRKYSRGHMARITLEGTHGSLQGVVWDEALQQITRALGREVELGDIIAVSGRVKTTTRRKATPAGDVAIDTDSGEELDERHVVDETEQVREISVNAAWAAQLDDGGAARPEPLPFVYAPRDDDEKRPRRRNGDGPDPETGPEEAGGGQDGPSGDEPDSGTPSPQNAAQGHFSPDEAPEPERTVMVVSPRADAGRAAGPDDAFDQGLADARKARQMAGWSQFATTLWTEEVPRSGSVIPIVEPVPVVEAAHVRDLDDPVIDPVPIPEGIDIDDWSGPASDGAPWHDEDHVDDGRAWDPNEQTVKAEPAPTGPKPRYVFVLDRNGVRQVYSKQWRVFREHFGFDISDVRPAASWGTKVFPDVPTAARDQKVYEWDRTYDMGELGEIAIHVVNAEWSPEMALAGCAELLEKMGHPTDG